MMNVKHFMLAAAMLFTVSASAQQAAAEASAKDMPEQAQLLQVAGQLVQFGHATKSALPLIQAVQIYQRLNVADEAREKTSEGTEAQSESISKTDRISYNEADILAAAEQYAEGDKNLLALIKETKGATRGAVGGPKRNTTNVLGGYTDNYTISFYGGQTAYVVVSGDGDTDLDLYVYDQNGNLIASDTDRTDQCVVYFTPRWTGPFYIKVKNLGRVYNHYTIYTN